MSIFGYISDGSGNTTSPYDQSNIESGEPPMEHEEVRQPRKALMSSTERMHDHGKLPFGYRCKSSHASLADPSENIDDDSCENDKDFWAPLHKNDRGSLLEDGVNVEGDSDRMIESDRSKIRHLEASLRAVRDANSVLRLEKANMIREYEQVIQKLLNLKLSPEHSTKKLAAPVKNSATLVNRDTQTNFPEFYLDYEKERGVLNSSCNGSCGLHCQSTSSSQNTHSKTFNPYIKEIILPHVEPTKLSLAPTTPVKEKSPDGMTTPCTTISGQTPTLTKPVELSEAVKSFLVQPPSEFEDPNKWTMVGSLVMAHRQTNIQTDSQNQTVVSTTVKRIKVDGQIVYEKTTN
jgi:hypothetical protein